MGDAKSAVHAQAAAASMALNLAPSAATAAATTATTTKSAPPTPHPGPAAPVPQLSPTPGARTGWRLHTKVLDELKHAATRKSPAVNPNAAPAGGPTGPLPSPLNLHALSSSEAPSEHGSTMLDDAGSPRIPAPPNGSSGKSKTCGICERSFTVFRAKHTCKKCGRKICDDCSKNRVKLHRRLERRKGSRLCDACARDHIQLATPLLSPSQAQIPEDPDDHTDDDSGRGGDAAFALGGRRAEKAKSTADLTREGFHRATSAIFRSSADAHLSTDAESFLRPRHWISFAALLVILVARVVRSKSASIQMRGDANAELMLFLISLTNWIEYIASLRVIGSYVLGLVVYDEFTARSQRKLHQRRAQALTAASSSAPSLIASMPHSRRSRTRSALSDSARSAAGSGATQSVPAAARERADEDEVLEVEVGDKHADDGLGFSYDKLQSSLTDATVKNRASDGGMKMSSFLAACDNVCGFILVFGRATAFAASTVTGYMSTITTNLAGWPVPASPNGSVPFSWKEQSVRAVVLREVELQVAAAGGKKKPSCSRCVLRLLWFIEFVEACMRYTLIENADEHCAAGASKAYEETIGARHPWIIRKGVNSALGSLPSRSAIISSLNLHEMSPEDTIMHLRKVQGNMRAMLDEVTALLKEHNLLDIK